MYDVLSKKSNDPVDIMILDYKQMFDSECLFQCMNDLFEAGVDDDIFALIYEANRKNYVAVKTPNGLSRREVFSDIVMQGDVLAPLISSLQVDTIGKECLEDNKHLYYYKNVVPVPPLGLVEDLFTISTCNYKTTLMNKYINSKTAMKRLQFGTTKCFKLHVGKTCNEALCKDLFVGGWKREVIEDSVTGEISQTEEFGGLEKMKVKSEQMYLGDLISADGSHAKNVQQRKNKAIGIINQIMQILETVYFGKYHFEVAMILRSSMLLSSLLLNSEAWVNLKEKDIRCLEQSDEILLGKVLDCEANTSNIAKYLELGIQPIRFEIMKRKIIYLQYILKQEKKSMIFKVFQATCENMIKDDFVQTCIKYLEILDIHLSFKEIEEMSVWCFKKLVKQKSKLAAFRYLLEKKNEPNKQLKISHILYEDLEIQEYLLDGNRNTKISQLIFKARTKTLDIKTWKRWKYDDDLCVGCSEKSETIEEILICKTLNEKEGTENVDINCLFGQSQSEIFKLGAVLMRRLRKRENLLEGVT